MSWFLVTSLLVLSYGVAPPPAAAQEREARSAVVLDFATDVSALSGRAAAAAIAQKMTERGYDVRSRSEVVDAVNLLNLREPYEPDEIQRLAREVDAQTVVSGRVLRVESVPGPPAATRVVLQVEVYDGATGDLFNGAVIDHLERTAGGTTADQAASRDEAIERAAEKALNEIESRSLVTAAVLQYSPRGDSVLMRPGSRAGVQNGMLFDVFRTVTDPADPNRTMRLKVGRIRVTDVSADDATAVVVSAPQGIQLTDQLREVYVLATAPSRTTPEGTVIQPPSRAPQRGGISGMLMPVLGVLAGVAILAGLFAISSSSNTDAPSVNQAQGAFLYQSQPGSLPSIEVTWSDRDFVPPRNFIGGYLVYRNEFRNFPANENEATGAVIGNAQRQFSDTPDWRLIETVIPVRFLRQSGTDVEEVEEEVDVTIVHTSPQPGRTYFYKVRRLGPPDVLTPPTIIESGSGTGGTGGLGGGSLGGFRSASARQAHRQYMRARSRGQVLASGGNIRIERRPGTRVTRQRQVGSIPPGGNFDPTQDPDVDNDIEPGAEIGLSNASAPIGPVTYIVPPEPRGPSNNNQAQRVDDITFQFQGQLGATEYVLQIATDVNFQNLVFQSAPQQNTSASLLSFGYNNTQAGFNSLNPNTTYFWRIGARSTFENQPPPQPNGYVFSQVFQFTTADQPPAAP